MWHWYVWWIYFRNPKSNSRTCWEDSPAKPAFWGDLNSFSLARCCICTAVYVGILSCCDISMYVPGAPVPIRLEAPPQPLAWVMNQVPAVLKNKRVDTRDGMGKYLVVNILIISHRFVRNVTILPYNVSRRELLLIGFVLEHILGATYLVPKWSQS